MQSKIGFLSKNICVPWSKNPVSGVLLIENGQVVEVVHESEMNFDQLVHQYQLEDLGDFFILPGIVDINVEIGAEDFISVTKAAICGGVTTIATIDQIQNSSQFFSDIAPIGVLQQDTQIVSDQYWAYKAFISPLGASQSLNRLEQALYELEIPLIVYPEYSFQQILSSGTKRVDLRKITQVFEDQIVSEDSESEEQESPTNLSTQIIQKQKKKSIKVSPFFVPGELPSNDLLVVPQTDYTKLKRGSVRNIPGIRKGSFLVPTQEINRKRHSVSLTQQASQHFLLQDIPFIDQVQGFEQAYANHKAKYPIEYETNAIHKIIGLKPQIPIHFCNLSSVQAINLVSSFRNQNCQVTCETSFPYLYYNEKDIKRGDGSYKVKPPIRDIQNQCLLWDKLKDGNIDCVTSYHQPRSAFQKMIGPFKDAVDGISSIGFLLQAVWTKLKQDLSPGMYPQFISMISHWLSFCPARILGIKAKGSLEKGKDADFLVFDPYSKQVVNNDMHKFKSISPIVNDELDGVVLRTYLRGQLIFSPAGASLTGRVLRRG